ncbi:MAG: hypothetical protein OK438_00300 [Thaumarchaeota archaeon]|nr:hypothetical protein [Nitrososphaerota archaeon]
MIGPEVPLSRRVLKATLVLVLNATLWILVPSILGAFISRALPSSPLTIPLFIYEFGAIITGLQVLGALTEGKALSIPFVSGSYVVSAYYIWVATDGGNLPLTAAGVDITLAFRPIVFLIMLPSLFGALRAPLTFLLEESEVARLVPDEV